ncbi:MAG TPA: manganese catalase family protein [Candidatus Eisenbergiella pullicola]|nr:manganese catalase family protein [Candidatus Eisenbergiella pullicola]
MLSFSSLSDPCPYPPLRVERPNPLYASEMLSNIGACNSEMSAISLYLYNSTILTPVNREFAEIFHKLSAVEMHHLNIFSHLAHMLGADPRLWTCSGKRPCYWSPACNHYPRQLVPLLKNALQGEQDAILKYRRQADQICDAYVTDLINRIILDEQIHVEIFREMIGIATASAL